MADTRRLSDSTHTKSPEYDRRSKRDPASVGPDPSSRIPVVSSRMPKKGILKRSSSMRSDIPMELQARDTRDVLSPLRSDVAGTTLRYTPPRETAETGTATRIPKLQVHFPESADESSVSESAPGPQTQEPEEVSDRDTSPIPTIEAVQSAADSHERSPVRDVEYDDASSVGSSASQIVGQWWFGKETKYVPHCERRHLSEAENAEYLTPMQRRNREALELKRKLRTSEQILGDKEKHLVQLRERLTELENILESNGSLMENHRLSTRIKHLEKELDTAHSEQRMMAAAHETTMRDVEQGRYRSRNHVDVGVATTRVTTTSIAVMTESDMDTAKRHETELQNLRDQLTQSKCENAVLKTKLIEAEEKLSTQAADSVPIIPDTSSLSNQLQAYYNESIAWRTYASEIEIAYKQLKQDIMSDTSIAPAKKRSLTSSKRASVVGPHPPKSLLTTPTSGEQNGPVMSDSGFADGECTREACLLRRQDLISLTDDNEQLTNEIDELQNKLHETEKKLQDAAQKLDETSQRADSFAEQAKSWEDEVTMNQAKVDAAALSVTRLQEENVELLTKMENQRDEIDQLKNHMIDAGIFVGRKTLMVDKSYKIYKSIHAQTELTSQCISSHDDEFTSLTERIGRLEAKYKNEQNDWHDTLHEAQESLTVKSQLVKTLTNQLDTVNSSWEAARDQMSKERSEFCQKLEALEKVAERVPVLEIELDNAHEQLRIAELQLHEQQETYTEAIETSISDNMKRQQDTIDHWKQRLFGCQRELELTGTKLITAEKALADTKMRLNLEKLGLEGKLQEAYTEIEGLHTTIYKPTNCKEVQATVDMVDTGMLAKPVMTEANTVLPKGDLYDETEERLKLTTGELTTTRRQVEIMQDKFQEKLEEISETKATLEEINEAKQALESEIQVARDEFHTISKNYERTIENLEKHCGRLEDDKVVMHQAEKDRIRQIENEFVNVQQELDGVINKYEAEKRRLKDRVKDLESSNDGLRSEVKAMVETNALGQMLSSSANMNVLEFDLLEHRIESLTGAAEESEEGGMSPKSSRKRKDAPAIKFLLDRLQAERERYSEQNENLERQVRELNSHLELLQNVASPVKRQRLYRACSIPFMERDCMTGPSTSATATAATESAAVADLRVKNLLLMKENRKLMTDFEALRGSVSYVLIKQENVQTRAEQAMQTQKEIAEKAASAKVALTASVSHVHEESVPPDPRAGQATITVTHPVEQEEIVPSRSRSPSPPGSFLRGLLAKRLKKKERKDKAVAGTSLHFDVPPASTTIRPEVSQEQVTLLTPQAVTANRHSATDISLQSDNASVSSVSSRQERSAVEMSEGLANDLNEVRIDLQAILSQIDSATTSAVTNPTERQRENRLMIWLETELLEEKKELDALNNWYEMDKARLGAEMMALKNERSKLRNELDQMALDFHDCSRELEVYKAEDAARLGESKAADLARFRSFTDLPSMRSAQAHYKQKFVSVYRQFLGIQRDFELVDQQRRSYKQEVDIVTGEIEILRAEREVDLEKQASLAEGSGGQLSDDYRRRLRETYESQMTALRHQLEMTQKSESQVRGNITGLEKQCRELDKELCHVRNELRDVQTQYEDSKLELDLLKRKYNDVNEECEKLRAEAAMQSTSVSRFLAEIEAETVQKSRSLSRQASKDIKDSPRSRRLSKQVSKEVPTIPEFTTKAIEKSAADTAALIIRDATRIASRSCSPPPAEEKIASREPPSSAVGDILGDIEQILENEESLPAVQSVEAASQALAEQFLQQSSVPTASATEPMQVPGATSELDELDESFLVGSPEEELEQLARMIDSEVLPTFENKSEEELERIVHEMEQEVAQLRSGIASPVERPFSAPTMPFDNDLEMQSSLITAGDVELQVANAVFNREKELNDQHKLEIDQIEEKHRQQLVKRSHQMWLEFDEKKEAIINEKNEQIDALQQKVDDLQQQLDEATSFAAEAQHAQVVTVAQQAQVVTVTAPAPDPDEDTGSDYDVPDPLEMKDATIAALEERVDKLEADLRAERTKAVLRGRSETADRSSRSRYEDARAPSSNKLSVRALSSCRTSRRSVSFDTQARLRRSVSQFTMNEESYCTPPSTSLANVRKCESEPTLALLEAEERALMAEKELSMQTRELLLCQNMYERQVRTLQHERDELREKLHKAVLVAEKVCPPEELDIARSTVHELQVENDRLAQELEEKEAEQKEMYLIMFKKGQETCRRELAAYLPGGTQQRDRRSRSGSESAHTQSVSQQQPWTVHHLESFAEGDTFPIECEETDDSESIGTQSRASGITDDQAVLRFLRDATYYYLLNKNTKDHLMAMMSLLKFTAHQRREVQRLHKELSH